LCITQATNTTLGSIHDRLKSTVVDWQVNKFLEVSLSVVSRHKSTCELLET